MKNIIPAKLNTIWVGWKEELVNEEKKWKRLKKTKLQKKYSVVGVQMKKGTKGFPLYVK